MATRTSCMILTAALLATAAGTAAAQSQFPDRPVHLVVGFSAGGSIDGIARLMAEELQQVWGQTVVIENRVGAGGSIAANYVANAKPDGYTLLATTASHTAAGALRTNLPYDSYSDFTPIILLASAPNVLVTRADSPLKTLDAYLEAARARPGEVSYASSAVGGILHFTGEQFNHTTGIQTNHIPYKGANDVVMAVLSGTVDSSWSVAAAAVPHLGPNGLHLVGVASAERSSLIPDVPTFAELGVDNMVSDTWFGILGPADMPADLTEKIYRDMAEILAKPEMEAKLASFGVEPRALGPQAFGQQIHDELEQFSVIAKAANITLE